MATDVTLAILDSIGSICIKAVASKIMNSVFSISYFAFRYAFELMDEIWSLIRAIVFENILRLSKDKMPP